MITMDTIVIGLKYDQLHEKQTLLFAIVFTYVTL
jgi:hypothetical protein